MLIIVKPLDVVYTPHHAFERNGGRGERNSQFDLIFEIDGQKRTACLSRHFGWLDQAQREALKRHLPSHVRVRVRKRQRRLWPYLGATYYVIERSDLDDWWKRTSPRPPDTIETALAEGWTISRESGRQIILVRDQRSITRYR